MNKIKIASIECTECAQGKKLKSNFAEVTLVLKDSHKQKTSFKASTSLLDLPYVVAYLFLVHNNK